MGFRLAFYDWKHFRQTIDETGLPELQARVKAKTVESRRNPADRRFWQFRSLSESEAVETERKNQSKVKGSLDAKLDDMIQWDRQF